MRRLSFIRHARQLGFEMPDIRTLLELSDSGERPCADADAIARRHLQAVDEKIGRLERLRAELARMVDHRHGQVADCRVIETLAHHDLCKSEHG